jgi:hypothetical protein
MAINASSGGQLQGGTSGGGGLTEEEVQDIVADSITIGSGNISLGLQAAYDDTTGKLVLSLGNTGGGTPVGANITVSENATVKGTVTALNFVGSSVGVQDNIATITGGLDSIPIFENTSNRGNLTSINFVSGATVSVDGGVANVTVTPTDLTAVNAAIALKADSSTLTTDIANLNTTLGSFNTTLTNNLNALAQTVAGLDPVPDLTGFATETFVIDRINSVIDGAPVALNTLREISDALGNNEDLASTLTNEINDRVTLAGLQAELANYTTTADINSQFAALADRDEQTLSLVGTSLAISNGNAVDLSSAGFATTSQIGSAISTALASLATDSELSDATVQLTAYVDQQIANVNNTITTQISSITDSDNQTLTLAGTNLGISNGNVVNLGASFVTPADLTSAINTATTNITNNFNSTVNSIIDSSYATDSELSDATVSLTAYIDSQIQQVQAGQLVLPTASTTVLGGVKVDGTTITINNGVISAVGGGSGLNNTIPTDVSDLTDTQGLLVHFDGDYNSLTNKPTLITQGDIDTAIAGLVDSAPGTLDTLNELAAALGDDPNAITTLTNSLADKLNISGGTMTGTLKLAHDPIALNDAANKNYVDNEISTVTTSITGIQSQLVNAISDLSDVDTSGVTNGQALVFNSSTAQWEPGAVASSYGDADVSAFLNGNLDGHIIPDSNAVYDLGTAEKKFRDLYLSDATIHLGDSTLSRDFTTGRPKWDGEDLFDYNNLVNRPTIPTGGGNVTVSNTEPVGLSDGDVWFNNDTGEMKVFVGALGDFQIAVGQQGIAGNDGAPGNNGAQGPQGVSVTSAVVDINGDLQVTLSNASTINAGSVIGPQGPVGATGAQGGTGPTGATGPTGPVGATGLAGADGAGITNVVDNGNGTLTLTYGATGLTVTTSDLTGPTGATGPAGAQGIQGVKGDTGDTGPQGPVGATGPAGAKGDTGDAGPQGIQGIQGPAGNDGADGIQLTDISVTQAAASGTGALAYNSATGVITYTPPDLSGFGSGTSTVSNIADLGDVVLTNPTSGQVLKYNGSDWVNAADATGGSTIGSTTDVPEGTNLYYTDARADARIAAAGIEDLANVSGTVPTTGQALAWNGASWAPTTISSGGGGGSGSGIFAAHVQINYTSSGALSNVVVLSGGISATIVDATSSVCTVEFTFTGCTVPPISVGVYGYLRTQNQYVYRAVDANFNSRVVEGGGASGSPTAFTAFDSLTSTMTLSLTKALTGATSGLGQTTEAMVMFTLI